MPKHFIIIGGGQAAAQAVQTLRQKKFDGTITLIGEEGQGLAYMFAMMNEARVGVAAVAGWPVVGES